MSDVFFFIKMMVLTAVVVLAMQIRWGDDTIENHTMDFLTSAAIVKPIDQTAGAAVVFVRNTWSKVTAAINTNFSHALREENQPGSRHKFFNVSREKLKDGREALRGAGAEVQEAAAGIKASAVKKWQNRDKFIDETLVPGQESNRASSTSANDESLEQ